MSAHEETPKPAPEGRDSNGRFAKGNPGGPGNPFARRVAQMRSLALEVERKRQEEATASVNKRPKRPNPKPMSAGSPMAVRQTEGLRLIDPTTADQKPTDRRAANKRR